MDPLFQVSPDRRDPGGNVHVALRAVGDPQIAPAHQLDLRLGGMHAVGHDGLLTASEKPVTVVHGPVERRFGMQGGDKCDLARILRQMRLNGHMLRGGKFAKRLHKPRRAGGDKARRDDRARPRKLLRLLKETHGLAKRLVSRLDVIGRAFAVHVDLADHGHEPGLLEHLHQEQGAVRVNGAEDDGPCRP